MNNRIYINGRFLTQPMTGVERYSYSICQELLAMGQPFTLVCPKAPIQECYDTEGMTIVRFGKGGSHFWEQCVLPFFFLGKRNFVLLNFMGLGPVLIRKKVMTIHDLSFLENPAWFSRLYYLWYKMMTPLAARTSRQIITVSDFSKKEILRFYPFLKAEKINVIYSAPDLNRFCVLPDKKPSTQRFALAVSSLDPRKNFDRLVQAFQGIQNCQLYIIGKHNRVFGKKDETISADNIEFRGRVSDQELLLLYNQATCFLFPSVYEGFGLPPIEAMTCGCPVLASDIPVVHEVCSDAAIYFDPYSVDDIRQTIEQYLNNDDSERELLRQRGFQNIQRFSWRKSAEAVIDLVQKISS